MCVCSFVEQKLHLKLLLDGDWDLVEPGDNERLALPPGDGGRAKRCAFPGDGGRAEPCALPGDGGLEKRWEGGIDPL